MSAFRHCWCRCWCGVGGAAGVVAGVWCGGWGGGGSILSGVSIAAGDVVSCGTGNQISLNPRGLTGLRPPLVTLSLRCWITCGSVAANISALPLSGFPHISLPLSGCCGVWHWQLFFVACCCWRSILGGEATATRLATHPCDTCYTVTAQTRLNVALSSPIGPSKCCMGWLESAHPPPSEPGQQGQFGEGGGGEHRGS